MITEIILNNVSFRYHQSWVINNLNLRIQSSQYWHIQGENGSGKSTLLELIGKIKEPSQGEVIYDFHPSRFTNSISYCGHQLGLKSSLTVMQNLRWRDQLYRSMERSCHLEPELAPITQQQRVQNALEFWAIDQFADQPLHQLSAGQKKRASLACLTLSNAQAWLLDEPYASLDQPSIEILNKAIELHLSQAGSAILSSHQAPLDHPSQQVLELN